MPSTDRKLELQTKDIDVSTVSQPAVCSNGLTQMRGNIVKNTTCLEKMYSKTETTCFGLYWPSSGFQII